MRWTKITASPSRKKESLQASCRGKKFISKLARKKTHQAVGRGPPHINNNPPNAFWGLLGPRKDVMENFTKNRKQADGYILGNSQQHDDQSKKYTLGSRSIRGSTRNMSGV